jgi:hypothetical protein
LAIGITASINAAICIGIAVRAAFAASAIRASIAMRLADAGANVGIGGFMETAELQTLLNKLKDVRDSTNWAGKFDAYTRTTTKAFRVEKMAVPLDEVIVKLQVELNRRVRKRNTRRISAPRHLAFKDD